MTRSPSPRASMASDPVASDEVLGQLERGHW